MAFNAAIFAGMGEAAREKQTQDREQRTTLLSNLNDVYVNLAQNPTWAAPAQQQLLLQAQAEIQMADPGDRKSSSNIIKKWSNLYKAGALPESSPQTLQGMEQLPPRAAGDTPPGGIPSTHWLKYPDKPPGGWGQDTSSELAEEIPEPVSGDMPTPETTPKPEMSGLWNLLNETIPAEDWVPRTTPPSPPIVQPPSVTLPSHPLDESPSLAHLGSDFFDPTAPTTIAPPIPPIDPMRPMNPAQQENLRLERDQALMRRANALVDANPSIDITQALEIIRGQDISRPPSQTGRTPRQVNVDGKPATVLVDPQGYFYDVNSGQRVTGEITPYMMDVLTPAQQAVEIQRLYSNWGAASESVQNLDTAIDNMAAGLAAALAGDRNAGSQAVLVTFQKFLDEDSVVRESEYARSGQGQSILNVLKGIWAKAEFGGTQVTNPELETFYNLAKDIIGRMSPDEANSLLAARKARIARVADHYGIPQEFIFEDYDYTRERLAEGPASSGLPRPATRGEIATPEVYAAYGEAYPQFGIEDLAAIIGGQGYSVLPKPPTEGAVAPEEVITAYINAYRGEDVLTIQDKIVEDGWVLPSAP